MIPPAVPDIYLAPEAFGHIAVWGGHGLFGTVVCLSRGTLQASLGAARDALDNTAYCRRCRTHRSIRSGSHCRRCGVRLRSVLEWELWSPLFQVRFCLDAFDIYWQQANPPPPAISDAEESSSE